MSQPTPSKNCKDWTQATMDDLMSDSEDDEGTANAKSMEKACWSEEEQRRWEALKAQRKAECEVHGLVLDQFTLLICTV